MVRKLALFVVLATAALCAQTPVSGAPNHGVVNPAAQNQVAIYANSGTAKTLAGDSNLTDTGGTLSYGGANGINSNNGFSSSGATGAGQYKLAQGTEVSPPAGYVTLSGPVTLSTAYEILFPGAPSSTLPILSFAEDGDGNMVGSWTANQMTGCTSGCNYVLTTSDQIAGAGAAGATLSTVEVGQYVQFWNNATRKISNACIQIATLDSGGHVDVGLYSISGTTGTLQWHTGSQSTTTAGAICVTPTAYTLTGGANYYIAWCADNTTAILEAITSAAVIEAAGPAHTAGVDATDTCSSGVLPSSITTTNIANTSTHLIVPYVYVSN